MGRRTGQSGGEAAPPTLPLTTPLLTRWVREHLIRGELAFEYPHSKGLRFLGREEKFQGAGSVRLLVYKGQSHFRVTYRLDWFLSGRRIGEGVWLVQNRLGKGGEQLNRFAMGLRVCQGEPREALALATVHQCLFPSFLTRAPWLALSPSFGARAVTR